MEYRSLKNKHQGEKIIVCGLGKSLLSLTNPEKYITVGVNDIGRKFIPNYLVVLNDRSSFSADRWKWIESTQSPVVFTHIKTLAVPEERRCLLQLGKYGGFDLDKNSVDYTSNSPYVACIIAYFLGAKRIGLLGVDFTLHHFFGNTGEHVLSRKVNTINREYMSLQQAMSSRGVELVNLSQESQISIPKMTFEEFDR